jgi:hypothetical protein
VVAEKIGSSNFKTESKISEFMAYVIEELLEDKQFNSELMLMIE